MTHRAKVIFTDGFHVSPTVETVIDDGLRDALRSVVGHSDVAPRLPATAASRFAFSQDDAGLDVALYNTPEGRSYGVTLAMIQHPDFWRRDLRPGHETGVFLVNLVDKTCTYWGDAGFPDSPEFTPTIPQVEDWRKPACT